MPINTPTRTDEKANELRLMLSEIELKVLTSFTLADAIRFGSRNTSQVYGWGDGDTACALHAGLIGAKAAGYVK